MLHFLSTLEFEATCAWTEPFELRHLYRGLAEARPELVVKPPDVMIGRRMERLHDGGGPVGFRSDPGLGALPMRPAPRMGSSVLIGEYGLVGRRVLHFTVERLVDLRTVRGTHSDAVGYLVAVKGGDRKRE